MGVSIQVVSAFSSSNCTVSINERRIGAFIGCRGVVWLLALICPSIRRDHPLWHQPLSAAWAVSAYSKLPRNVWLYEWTELLHGSKMMYVISQAERFSKQCRHRGGKLLITLIKLTGTARTCLSQQHRYSTRVTMFHLAARQFHQNVYFLLYRLQCQSLCTLQRRSRWAGSRFGGGS